MPKKKTVNKVLVIGSGPIVIGQAAEFDYAGTQACLTLKEAGAEVILLNNNPATMMTDHPVADQVYFEALTVTNIESIIQQEEPDALLASVSGQTGLTLAFQLEEEGILEKYNVEMLGTTTEAIRNGEDREQFRSLMNQIEEPVPESEIIHSVKEALQFSKTVPFPIIIRPAYTLGGSGGGIATNQAELKEIVARGLKSSPIQQCLVEKSIAGWKEIEFEVICDKKQQAIVVCHMENIDPVGVHTGDSMVVAPIQTLTEEEIALLRQASLHIVKELGIVGACNVQLGYQAETKEYRVIEVNPRVSRSSALASKATGYPIAKIATKLGLGYTLDELYDHHKQTTLAMYEPTFSYTVVKFPCWPFDKLTEADRTLGTQMKATGEVMAIEKTVHAGIQKAVRSLDLSVDGIRLNMFATLSDEALEQVIEQVDDRRFFAIIELLYRGYSLEKIYHITQITFFFLEEMKYLVDLERSAKALDIATVSAKTLLAFKQAGITTTWLASVWDCSLETVQQRLAKEAIQPVYQAIEAYSETAEEEAAYYFAVWHQGAQAVSQASEQEKVLIIGSGPIRIGQGVEFDYCSVKAIEAAKKYGYETVLMNNNPATVSTDYEFADHLYFEPLTAEDVLQVMAYEQIEKVMIQFGGQTALNLVDALETAGVTFLGTKKDTIDQLEDRDRFYQYAANVNVPHIPGVTAYSEEDLGKKAEELGYPLMIRPSYVIGGQGMAILETAADLQTYIDEQLTNTSYPILIDAYLPGKEVEVDALTDGESVLIPAIFEHIEKAGVHSGDSMAITPPITLTEAEKQQIVLYTERIAQGMDFKGIFNIQFVLFKNQLYVLEVNPRASRTVPVASKVTGVNMIELATATLLGESLAKLSKHDRILPENDFYTVKAPVFSNVKLPGVDPKLVPEMKSTGEIIGMADTVAGCMTKVFKWNEPLRNQLQKPEKELFAETFSSGFLKSEKTLQSLGIEPVYLEDQTTEEVDDWFISPQAYALFSQAVDSTWRKRAVECQLLVMSREETLHAFKQITEQDLPVISLQKKEVANEKEEVVQ
ncbi:MAG TPA: carbamoyl phosphate synthase large subunit [Pseudogracilibacillus sp.]|nr:carbamoyl phosphate synthase large subunit [Pseudogracilibacillus sp.]